MNIDQLRKKAQEFGRHFADVKSKQVVDFGWYPYGTLSNFEHLKRLLDADQNVLELLGAGPLLDIGAADGDMAFFLETLGYQVQVVDNAPTNYNSCRGLRQLKTALNSSVSIFESDIDKTFDFGPGHFSFAFFLGILYHLKNPYGVLESLAKQVKYSVISTRITKFNIAKSAATGQTINAERVNFHHVPAAYLVSETECNNDATNFWMFTEQGLKRILDRTGWEVLKFITVGNTSQSDPATAAGDERAFCLVKSKLV